MEYLETYEWNPDARMIQQAAQMLKQGEIGIIPTDTIYAFVCLIDNKKGIERICKLVGKKPEKANLSVIFNDLKHISDYTRTFDTPTFKILKRNLPGPFTFVMNAGNKIPKLFLNNKKTLGIRIPNHIIPQQLCEMTQSPLIVSSVHSEDEVLDYLTDPYDIKLYFENDVDFLINTGVVGNTPSTVVDLTQSEPQILRQAKGDLLL